MLTPSEAILRVEYSTTLRGDRRRGVIVAPPTLSMARRGRLRSIAMPECSNCDAHVTARFKRVFSGADGEVYGCPERMTNSELFNGGTVEGEE